MYLYAFGISALKRQTAGIMIASDVVLLRIKEHRFAPTIAQKLVTRAWPCSEGWCDHAQEACPIGDYRFADDPDAQRFFIGLAVAAHPEDTDGNGDQMHRNCIFTAEAPSFEIASCGFEAMMRIKYPLLCGWQHHGLRIVEVTRETTRCLQHQLLC